MSDMILPVGGGDGFGGSGAVAAGVGAFAGSIFGSVFGNGWGGGGWGGRGVGGAEGVVVQNSLDTNAILQAVNASSLANIQGQNGTNLTVERSAASTYSGLTQQNTQNLLANVQGFAGLNTVIQQGTNTTVAAIGAASALSTQQAFQAQLDAQRCCCETNLNIERQGNETRALLLTQEANRQAILICDLKAQITQRDFLLSQAAQTAQLNCKINQVSQLVDFKIPTPPTPPTGCC